MIRKLLHTILAPRHPWRKLNFSELGELYIASMLRDFALSLVGIFIPIYLFNNGFSVPDILFFFAMFYAFGMLGIHSMVGRLIARFGPKHVISFSFIPQIIFFMMLASLAEFGWSLWLLSFVARVSSSSFYTSFHVDFSKIKHSDHSGKEMGFMNILSKIAVVISPVAGGIIATVFGPQSILIVASVVLVIAVIPLMMSKEPVKTHQKFTYKGIGIAKMKRALLVNAFSNMENSLTIWLWPLYVGIFIFLNEPYLKLGIVTSLGVVISIFAALVVGKVVDNKKGYYLLQYSVIANSFVHVLRLFATGLKSVIFINILNEPITTAYRMSFMKGYYDSTDDHPGYRIAYIVLSENIMDCMRALVWAALGGVSLLYIDAQQQVVASGFVVAAIFSLLVLFQRFPALKKQ